MIYELRTYRLLGGALPRYEEIVKLFGRPVRGDDYGTLVGHWFSEFGVLDRLLTLWRYDGLEQRQRARAALAENERWQKEFLPRIDRLIVSKRTVLLNPAFPLKAPSTKGNVYELRTDRVHVGKVREWIDAFQTIAPARDEHIGLWSTEVGELEDVVHLWAYPSVDAIVATRTARLGDPAWQTFVARTSAIVREVRSDVLRPTSLSPLS